MNNLNFLNNNSQIPISPIIDIVIPESFSGYGSNIAGI